MGKIIPDAYRGRTGKQSGKRIIVTWKDYTEGYTQSNRQVNAQLACDAGYCRRNDRASQVKGDVYTCRINIGAVFQLSG
jgi:hypothetical protein